MAGSCRASRRWRAAFRSGSSFSGDAASNGHRRRPTSARPTSSARATRRRQRPRARLYLRSAARRAPRWARRSSTSTASRCRSSARTATSCRRTTSGTPTRFNHDLTLFKNFAITGDQKLQFRVGFFNMFNQAFANTNIDASDINLTLDTTCRVTRERRARTARAASPTTSATRPRGSTSRRRRRTNFGKINLKRGHRVIEFVLKYYF